MGNWVSSGLWVIPDGEGESKSEVRNTRERGFVNKEALKTLMRHEAGGGGDISIV